MFKKFTTIILTAAALLASSNYALAVAVKPPVKPPVVIPIVAAPPVTQQGWYSKHPGFSGGVYGQKWGKSFYNGDWFGAPSIVDDNSGAN
ncbi:MAG: hypothetical protein M3O03_12195 [Pseudomonadota bacterium]|nr:hypothetical protein [Pseudomonadota bacterium]